MGYTALCNGLFCVEYGSLCVAGWVTLCYVMGCSVLEYGSLCVAGWVTLCYVMGCSVLEYGLLCVAGWVVPSIVCAEWDMLLALSQLLLASESDVTPLVTLRPFHMLQVANQMSASHDIISSIINYHLIQLQ